MSIITECEIIDNECNLYLELFHNKSKLDIDEVLVDTGFTGHLFLPESYITELNQKDFYLYPLSPENYIEFGNGQIVSGDKVISTFADINKINEYVFNKNKPEIEILIHGNGKPAIGMEILKKWISKIDGPKELFTLLFNE